MEEAAWGRGPHRLVVVDIMNVLTAWNHELLNWAKQKMFQALWHEHLQPAAVTDFCSVLAMVATCVGPRLFFCPQHQSKFSANNIPFQSLKTPEFCPWWDAIWVAPQICGPQTAIP